MKAGKWILATAALATVLTAGAFAEDHDWNRGRERDDAPYAQRYHGDRDDSWNNRYRDDGYRNRDHDRDHDRRLWAHNDRDHRDHDRDNRGRDRD